jgi:sortase A
LNPFLDEEELKSLFGTRNVAPSLEPPTSNQTAEISPDRFKPQPETTEPIFPEETNQTPAYESKTRELSLRFFKASWKFVALFVVIFFASFALINYSALSLKLSYFYKHPSGQNSTPVIAPTASFNPLAQATLSIPKIGTNAPIVWNVPEDNFNTQLLAGVVHFAGTALPGQNGNIFITGHSSYYAWVDSPYKDVFALLNKVQAGDKIYIQYENIMYTYTVNGSKVVKPNDMQVLGSGPTPTLTLMTCVPIGTNLNRLIITADQTSVSG